MARIRTIKPEFPESESMGRCSRDARLLFIMLFTLVDDEGRARAAPVMLAGKLFPYDDDARTHILEWMFELEREGCVRLYTVDGNAYLQIEKWLSHQKIERPSKSRLPAPAAKILELAAKPREASVIPREDAATDLVPRTVEGTKDMSAGADRVVVSKPNAEGFEEFWKLYDPPKNSRKPDAIQAWVTTAPKRPPLPDLLRAASGYNAFLSSEWAKNRRQYPAKQHAATWLRGELWANFSDTGAALTPEQIAANKDRADQIFYRGKYAEKIA